MYTENDIASCIKQNVFLLLQNTENIQHTLLHIHCVYFKNSVISIEIRTKGKSKLSFVIFMFCSFLYHSL